MPYYSLIKIQVKWQTPGSSAREAESLTVGAQGQQATQSHLSQKKKKRHLKLIMGVDVNMEFFKKLVLRYPTLTPPLKFKAVFSKRQKAFILYHVKVITT